jgi:hypothetical protein
MIRACGFVRSKSLSAVQILVLWGCGNAADNYWQRLEGRTNRSISTRSSLPRWHDISENFAGLGESWRRGQCSTPGLRHTTTRRTSRRPEAGSMVVETGSAPISGAGQETYRLSADGLDQGRGGSKLVRVAARMSRGRAAPGYFSRRINCRPAFVVSSFASSVPSPSGFAALKRCSTAARYSSFVRVPS